MGKLITLPNQVVVNTDDIRNMLIAPMRSTSDFKLILFIGLHGIQTLLFDTYELADKERIHIRKLINS